MAMLDEVCDINDKESGKKVKIMRIRKKDNNCSVKECTWSIFHKMAVLEKMPP